MLEREPNQKGIRIHKPTWNTNFLVVGRDEWYKAANMESNSKNALIAYLYLLDNKDEHFELWSPANMSKLFGKDKKTWERAFDILKKEGYIVHRHGEANNNFHFYATPQPSFEQLNADCSFDEYIKYNRDVQDYIYENILLKMNEEDMTKEQLKIYNFYLQFLIDDGE